jgi:hypothetical protein
MAGRGLGVQRADARPRLVARCAVAAERAAAHSTQCAPKMRLEPRIAPGGGRGGRWRRSARGRSRLGLASSKMRPLADTRPRLAARRAVSAERAAAHSTQRAPEMRLEPRIGDRPRRRPWWSVARIAERALYGLRPQAIIAKHSSRSPTHAHFHPHPQCGRCRERLPPRAQLHTGTELSPPRDRAERLL